jgi:uncharacterized protein (DUF58 family)
MNATVDSSNGIKIDVDELIAVRNRLSDLSGIRMRRYASARSGARELQLRGRGMEYAESRAYVYGDDIRTMDWRVMARTGEAHSKVFAEEKDRCYLLAVDLSESMFFGTRYAFKSWAAAQVAAHVGWLASFAGERIGGLVATPGYHSEIRPGKTRSGLLGVFHHLAQADRLRVQDAGAGNRLGLVLSELKRVLRPGARIALISDFLGVDEQSLHALANITRHNQVTAYWIYDDSEFSEWPPGYYPVLGDDGEIMLDLEDSHRRDWLEQLQFQHRTRLQSLCSRFEISLQPICCNHDITAQVLAVPA